MKFKDANFSKEHRFSIGIEEESNKYYISFPAYNGIVEYEEYYEISQQEYLDFDTNLSNALTLLQRCKERKEESRLLYQPSIKRGSPC
ncbi:MAG: hypothetical protein HQK50_08125 [Oligoflexia bacterium]|nr:hypothetical protein [Oligoflexia bacterium]MBF0365524.1 hypothetical protein [Oligoflexia bacterium]